jgi:UDP-3-O-[3-hydroxymyristoyl] N-acetylglucosamine deacetylase
MTREAGEVVREGRGLHTASLSRVVLRRRRGPVALLVAGREVPLRDAGVVATKRATTIDAGGRKVATVEHLLAAFGGLGVHQGVSIEVLGAELPLLDGAAKAYCDALRELGASRNACGLEVAREGEVRVGASLYCFERAHGSHLEVAIDFNDPRLAPSAAWDGDPDDFQARIAPARTFAFADEVQALALRGGITHVNPESVVVLGEREVFFAGDPFHSDEPARHKLLDLVGDLFLYGGPPRGRIHASRPGHGATHAAMREAFERGIVRRTG